MGSEWVQIDERLCCALGTWQGCLEDGDDGICGVFRERAAGMYAVIPYAIAQGATEIPWALAQTILFTCISYWMIHFDFTAGELPGR